jgi:hypothetical protein
MIPIFLSCFTHCGVGRVGTFGSAWKSSPHIVPGRLLSLKLDQLPMDKYKARSVQGVIEDEWVIIYIRSIWCCTALTKIQDFSFSREIIKKRATPTPIKWSSLSPFGPRLRKWCRRCDDSPCWYTITPSPYPSPSSKANRGVRHMHSSWSNNAKKAPYPEP